LSARWDLEWLRKALDCLVAGFSGHLPPCLQIHGRPFGAAPVLSLGPPQCPLLNAFKYY
jgi:hypothetical protein